MERPRVINEPKHRKITGEIVYLDEARRRNETPKDYLDLSDMAIQMYETAADMYTNGQRPDIMNDYEKYDYKPSETVASCSALAGELLALKEPGSSLTFVDIYTQTDPETILSKLSSARAGEVLAENGEQLALPPIYDSYPELDIRKENSKLVGAGLRVWGWDSTKTIHTNNDYEEYKYPDDVLFYPSEEKNSYRQIELIFSYQCQDSIAFQESVSLHLRSNGSATIDSQIWVREYAETGYEGHGGSSLNKLTDEDVASFGDLIAEIVGEEPKSIHMLMSEKLQEVAETAATEQARLAVYDLIESTWPAQALYVLASRPNGRSENIAQMLRSEESANLAAVEIKRATQKFK